MDPSKPFECEEPGCNKAFSRRSDLVRHNRIHTNDRPFVCPYEGCDRDFIQRSALTVHIRVHTGERPHKCTWEGCNKAFADSSSLARHRRIHTGKRPYDCPACDRNFCRKTTLLRHVKRCHPDIELPPPGPPQQRRQITRRRTTTRAGKKINRRALSDDEEEEEDVSDDSELDGRHTNHYSSARPKRTSGRVPRVSYRQYTDTPSPSLLTDLTDSSPDGKGKGTRRATRRQSTASPGKYRTRSRLSDATWSAPAPSLAGQDGSGRHRHPSPPEYRYSSRAATTSKGRMTIVSQECHCAAHPDPHVHEIPYDGDEDAHEMMDFERASLSSMTPSPRMSYTAASYDSPATTGFGGASSKRYASSFHSHLAAAVEDDDDDDDDNARNTAPVPQREFSPPPVRWRRRASSVPAFEQAHPHICSSSSSSHRNTNNNSHSHNHESNTSHTLAPSPNLSHIGLCIAPSAVSDYSSTSMRLEEEHEHLLRQRYPYYSSAVHDEPSLASTLHPAASMTSTSTSTKGLASPRLMRTPSMSFFGSNGNSHHQSHASTSTGSHHTHHYPTRRSISHKHGLSNSGFSSFVAQHVE